MASSFTTMTGIPAELQKIDQQIITLLEERVLLCQEERQRNESWDSRDVEEEIVSIWTEEATDRGLDDMAVEKIAQLVVKLCKQEE